MQIEAEESADGSSLLDIAGQYVTRWKRLIAEHETFRDAAEGDIPGLLPHIARLRSDVVHAEGLVERAQQLQASGNDTDEAKKLKMQLSSSNLSSSEVLWNVVKKCHGVCSLERAFILGSASPTSLATRSARRERRRVLVNAVEDNGTEWLRVLTTTEHRLLLDMAANGWDFGNEPDSDSDTNLQLDKEDGISIVKITSQLVQAARKNPLHQNTRPRIHIVLTRVEEGKNTDIDTLLGRMRRLGGDNVAIKIDSANSAWTASATPNIEAALPRLLPQQLPHVTLTVNVDTCVLICLSSDITHSHVPLQSWHSQQRRVELAQEHQAPGEILRKLCSTLDGRQLVCTREAASKFREIVSTIATPTEARRAALLLAQAPETADGDDPIEEFRRLSIYPITSGMRLPIQVIADDWNISRIHDAVASGDLPDAALRVASDTNMTNPSLSVFSFGWASGFVTVTSNSGVRKQLARLINKADDCERWPSILLIQPSRSLYGKRKE